MPADDSQHPRDDASKLEYAQLAEIAENIATEIAVSEPDWCALAHEASALARALRQRCDAAV